MRVSVPKNVGLFSKPGIEEVWGGGLRLAENATSLSFLEIFPTFVCLASLNPQRMGTPDVAKGHFLEKPTLREIDRFLA